MPCVLLPSTLQCLEQPEAAGRTEEGRRKHSSPSLTDIRTQYQHCAIVPSSVILLVTGIQFASSLQLRLRRAMARSTACACVMTVFLIMLASLNICTSYKGPEANSVKEKPMAHLRRLRMTGGFGSSEIPKPKIITPSRGKKNSNLEKFLMMYTCKICDGRNAQMVMESLAMPTSSK